ncbi:MAG TPA: CDP-glucose 4,6-dehydratase [Verrucomicrobiae bacterium]|nr:CDP-glucose 4,6-dehydratase [Verrucomicrobiae bacterium]
MFSGFYQNKRVLVTGHTGFKGGWISLWLKNLGAQVHGISLPTPTHPNFHEVIPPHAFASETIVDIRDFEPLAAAIKKISPEMIFHLAAQAIVRRSYAEPLETFNTNATGTANLLESVRRAELPCPVIVITSDKCYENREEDYAYVESNHLGGHDVYSMSKAATELVAQSWNKSFFIPNPKLGPVATVRAGNVIGGGDYAPDRIVPDCIRALCERRPILVRNPAAVRPWQHVLECLSGYLWLGARLAREGKNSPLVGAFNFGPDAAAQQPVRKLVETVLRDWPGEWTDASHSQNPHEAKLLALSIKKAVALLDWHPVWNFSEAVSHTVNWYRARHDLNNADMLGFSESQIKNYVEAARQKKLAWTE